MPMPPTSNIHNIAGEMLDNIRKSFAEYHAMAAAQRGAKIVEV